MMEIPFAKLHGAENDFLLTWRMALDDDFDAAAIARRLCARHTGIGADGWMLVEPMSGGLATELYNSDGSLAQISGNGTRCAAAFALHAGVIEGPEINIKTTAGLKALRMLERRGNHFLFEMEMGVPTANEQRTTLAIDGEQLDVTILDVGNPQCAVFVRELPAHWRELGRAIESHSRFPGRTNVSFVEIIDRHTLRVHFYERGAGETRSSGTGSTGAAAAGILRGEAESPIEVKTAAGSLYLRWEQSMYLTGPAELVGEGRFFL